MTLGATAGGFSVDPWDPGYSPALSDDLVESSAECNLEVETPTGSWAPITPPQVALPPTVLFLDGVRRIDARVWVHGADPYPFPGLAASFAAGAVRCDGAARVDAVRVSRGLFTSAPSAVDIVTAHTTYPVRATTGGSTEELSLGLQQRLAEAEVALAVDVRATRGLSDDLLVVDGPLRGRTHLPRVVGYVKTHHASYLPASQAGVVATLAPGQRSPVFTMGTSWIRHSWYLRLPGPLSNPWAGVVRVECSADLDPSAAVHLANITALVLPPLASAPHKDPRAPQNLVPIGGLERELRHRLGDATLLYRSLRAAASASPSS